MSFRTPSARLGLGILIGSLAITGCSSSPQPKAPDSTAAAQASLTAGPWKWVATQTPVELIAPADPARYTIQFNADGSTALLADCNRGRGTYVTTAEGGITIGPAAVTRMMCPPGSLDSKYLQQLDNAAHTFFRGDTLYIDLKVDSGTMRFARGPAATE